MSPACSKIASRLSVCALLAVLGQLFIVDSVRSKAPNMPIQHAATPVPAEGIEYFETHIRPVLVQHCYECHSAGSKVLVPLVTLVFFRIWSSQ